MKQLIQFCLKRIFIVLITVLGFNTVYGFRPVAHIVLQKIISRQLPADNVFKIAMDSFPVFAAWGAVGPDIAYVPYKMLIPKWAYKRRLASSSNYADMAHYYKAGSFCKKLIEMALASNDKRMIAFAAGWITHVAGDFGSHGKYVYPEAGYYLDDHNGQSHHGEMEKWAESLIFVDKGKSLESSFYKQDSLDAKKIFEKFFEMPFGTFSVTKRKRMIRKEYGGIENLLKATFQAVYEQPFKADVCYFMKQYDQAFGKGIGKLKGFGKLNYKKDSAAIKFGNRQERLNEAFDYSSAFAINILTNHADGNVYSDRWNLDVGAEATTLVIRTTIDSGKYSGSKNPLFINLYLKTLHKRPLQFNIPIMGKVRYRQMDQLYAYIYLNECDYNNTDQYTFTISKGGKIKDRTVIKNFQIMYNGHVIYQNESQITLGPGKSSTELYSLSLPADLFKK